MGRSGTKARNKHRAGAAMPVLRASAERRPLAAPRRRVAPDSPAKVTPQTVRSLLALERASKLTGVQPVVLEMLAELNRTLGETAGPKRVRLLHRLVDQAAASQVQELTRPRACRNAAWCAREALRNAGVSVPAVDKPLQAMSAGEPVSLLAVGEALVALETVRGDVDKAAGRARYAAEVALGLCSTADDWRERFSLAARHAAAAVAIAAGDSTAEPERFFGGFVRRLAR